MDETKSEIVIKVDLRDIPFTALPELFKEYPKARVVSLDRDDVKVSLGVMGPSLLYLAEQSVALRSNTMDNAVWRYVKAADLTGREVSDEDRATFKRLGGVCLENQAHTEVAKAIIEQYRCKLFAIIEAYKKANNLGIWSRR